jgi:uncharacterized protein
MLHSGFGLEPGQSQAEMEMAVQRARKRPFKMDLARLHALCEANYARLLQLFPDYELANSREFVVAEARVRLDVLERSRYTTFFRLHQSHGEVRWLRHLMIDVRAYHDAGMLEVGAFQAQQQIQPRYAYPNPDMFQQDEKLQQNQFLSDWLEHCLANGRIQQPVLFRRLAP